eukprot:485202_1
MVVVETIFDFDGFFEAKPDKLDNLDEISEMRYPDICAPFLDMDAAVSSKTDDCWGNPFGGDAWLPSLNAEWPMLSEVTPAKRTVKKQPTKRKRTKDRGDEANKGNKQRSKNPYILFCEDTRHAVQQSQDLPPCEVERRLGRLWRNLPQEQKQLYFERARMYQERDPAHMDR